MLLKKDVLDRQLINVDGARLVRANEIELARLEGWYRVVGVDVSLRSLVRRVHAAYVRGADRRRAASSTGPRSSPSPDTSRRCGCACRTRSSRSSIPPQVADLVEAASHNEGEEIMAAVAADPEREADVFEELEDGHQREFVEDRGDEEIAELLGRMESDDAADLVLQLPEERREDVIELLSPFQARRLRTLLGYDPATAGGLMSPEFVCVYADATREEALERVQRSALPAESLAWVYGMNTHRRLRGGIALADLVRVTPEERLCERPPPRADGAGRRRPRGGRAVDDRLRPDRRPGRRRGGTAARDRHRRRRPRARPARAVAPPLRAPRERLT